MRTMKFEFDSNERKLHTLNSILRGESKLSPSKGDVIATLSVGYYTASIVLHPTANGTTAPMIKFSGRCRFGCDRDLDTYQFHYEIGDRYTTETISQFLLSNLLNYITVLQATTSTQSSSELYVPTLHTPNRIPEFLEEYVVSLPQNILSTLNLPQHFTYDFRTIFETDAYFKAYLIQYNLRGFYADVVARLTIGNVVLMTKCDENNDIRIYMVEYIDNNPVMRRSKTISNEVHQISTLQQEMLSLYVGLN